MSEDIDTLLLGMTGKFLDAHDLAAASGPTFWKVLCEIGIPDVLREDEHGGIGAGAELFAALVRRLAAGGADGIVAETAIARMLCDAARLDPGAGKIALAMAGADGDLAVRLPSGDAAQIAVLGADAISLRRLGELEVLDEHTDIASGILVRFSATQGSGTPLEPTLADRARNLALLARCAQIVGTSEAVLAMSLRYCGERVQFGRAISKFQAVQQQLSALAEEVAAGSAILSAAARGVEQGQTFLLTCACVRLADAADTVVRIAHQVHGAIGFTREYPLQLLTRQLMTIRNADGLLAARSASIAASVAGCSANELWPRLLEQTA